MVLGCETTLLVIGGWVEKATHLLLVAAVVETRGENEEEKQEYAPIEANQRQTGKEKSHYFNMRNTIFNKNLCIISDSRK